MLAESTTRGSTGKPKSSQDTNKRRVVATAPVAPVAGDEAAAVGTLETRLNSAARETFRNMGED
jgi:hypothetical protein